MVNLPSGKSEGRVVKSVAGRDVTVMADFSEQPQAECGWILDYEDLKLMQFYVRNVTRPEWHQFQFEVIQHDRASLKQSTTGPWWTLGQSPAFPRAVRTLRPG